MEILRKLTIFMMTSSINHETSKVEIIKPMMLTMAVFALSTVHKLEKLDFWYSTIGFVMSTIMFVVFMTLSWPRLKVLYRKFIKKRGKSNISSK